MSTIAFEKSIVSRMFQEAVEFCAKKSGSNSPEKALKAIGNGDCCVCEYLRYALARQVAEYLGSVDESITAFYSYEPEYATGSDSVGPGYPRTQPAMNLIARVNRKSAALSSVVASLSTALDERLRQLACSHANALCRELAIHLADEEDVNRRMGYGALINSLHMGPIEVWRR